MLTSRVREWSESGAREQVGGHELFVHRRPGDGPAMLWLHGFPSSSYDWRGLLAAHPEGDVLSFDFLGFGLSDKPADHVYTLAWQADAAEELVLRSGAEQVFVVAHDMGTSVATELMAREQPAPVVGARWEAVQPEHRGAVARAPVHEQLMPADLLARARLAPLPDP